MKDATSGEREGNLKMKVAGKSSREIAEDLHEVAQAMLY
jgi:hypothetical protein